MALFSDIFPSLPRPFRPAPGLSVDGTTTSAIPLSCSVEGAAALQPLDARMIEPFCDPLRRDRIQETPLFFVPVGSEQAVIVPKNERGSVAVSGSGVVVLILEEGARCVLSEVGEGDNAIFLLLGRGSRVERVRTAASGSTSVVAVLAPLSSAQSVEVRAGGSFRETSTVTAFLAEDAAFHAHTVSVLAEQGASTRIVRLFHRGDRSRSSVRGVAIVGDARSVVDLSADIPSGLEDARTEEDLRCIPVSPRADIVAVPRLSVASSTTRARHGLAFGGVSKDSLSFMRSRGLSESDARALILQGAVTEHLSCLKNERMMEHIAPLLIASLSTL